MVTTITITKPGEDIALGLAIANQRSDDGKHNLSPVIREVKPGSLAHAAGLKAGDRIVQINGTQLKSARGAAKVLRATQGDIKLLISPRPAQPSTDAPDFVATLTRALSFGVKPEARAHKVTTSLSFDRQLFATLAHVQRSTEEAVGSALNSARGIYERATGTHRVRAAVRVQTHVRSFIARMVARVRRQAVLLIQARVRGARVRARLAKVRAATVMLQAHVRGRAARRQAFSRRALADADSRRKKKGGLLRSLSFLGRGKAKDKRARTTSARAPLSAVASNAHQPSRSCTSPADKGLSRKLSYVGRNRARNRA